MKRTLVFYQCALLYVTAMTLVFVIQSCKDNTVGPIDSGEIWPLKPGNVWFYRVEHPTWIKDTLKMEITGTLQISYGGQTYTAMKMAFYGINEPLPEYQWLYWSGSDGVYLMGGVSPTDTFVVKELELKYPATVGDTWRYRSVAYSLSRAKFYIRDTLTYSLAAKDVSLETPAGNFKCYVYEFVKWPEDDVPDNWHYKYFYSPGVGLIGNITTSETEGGAVKEEFLLLRWGSK